MDDDDAEEDDEEEEDDEDAPCAVEGAADVDVIGPDSEDPVTVVVVCWPWV